MHELSNVDLRLLRVFLTVVRCGSFAAAQPVLNVGQPTISEQMNRLESYLGTRLCERGRGGFRLTEAGQQVHRAAQRLFTSMEDFRHEISDLGERLSGKLSIGLIDNTITNPASPLPDAIHRFSGRARDVQMEIEIKPPSELEQHVMHGLLHAAIGPCSVHVSGLDYSSLFEEEHFLYCSQKHALFSLEEITLPAIRGQRFVARSYMHATDLKLLDVKTPAAVIDNVEAQALLILTGEYIGFLPSHYAAQWVEKGYLRALLPEQLAYTSNMELIVKSGGYRSPVLTAFLDELAGGD